MKPGFHWKKSRVIELLHLHWGNQTIQTYSGFKWFALNTVLFGSATWRLSNVSLGKYQFRKSAPQINRTFPVYVKWWLWWWRLVTLVIEVGGINYPRKPLMNGVSTGQTLYKSVQPINRKKHRQLALLTTPVAIGLHGSFSRWCGHANHFWGRYRVKGERQVDMDDFLIMMEDGWLWSPICIRMMLRMKIIWLELSCMYKKLLKKTTKHVNLKEKRS